MRPNGAFRAAAPIRCRCRARRICFSANAQYQSSFYTSALHRPQDRVPGQTFVNGAITWVPKDDRFQIALEGKNILGADAPVGTSYTPSTGIYYKNYPDPATVLLRLRFTR